MTYQKCFALCCIDSSEGTVTRYVRGALPGRVIVTGELAMDEDKIVPLDELETFRTEKYDG